MDLGLTGKRALVLASSRGLGLGIAEAIAAEGADVLITGRDGARLEAAVAAINARGAGKARFVVSDLSDKATPALLEETSSGVIQPIPNLGLSNALRATLVGWSKSMANETAGDGVTFNMLLPGRIDTDRLKELDAANAKRAGKDVAEVAKAAQAQIPVGRYGAVEEFAATAAFLVSARASYINGSMIRCDGGAIKSV